MQPKGAQIPGSELGENHNWDITTACDIALSPIFRRGGPLEGRCIDIDPSSIETTLGEINPQASGKLFFEVSNRVNSTLKRKGVHGSTRRNSEIGEPVDAEVYVNFNSRFRPTVGPTWLQKVSAHELRHVADFCDEELMRREDQDSRYKKGTALVIGSTLISELLYFDIAHDLAGHIAAHGPHKVLAGILAAGLLFIPTVESVKSLVSSRYINRISEKNARKTTRKALRFPRIINLK